MSVKTENVGITKSQLFYNQRDGRSYLHSLTFLALLLSSPIAHASAYTDTSYALPYISLVFAILLDL